MTREVERLADASGFAVRRLTFDSVAVGRLARLRR
jgi:hypothetical protein